MSPVCSDLADLVLRFATWLNFYSAVQPCIRPATSKSRYLWLCMSLNHSILFLHHVLSPYSPIYKPSCSKCQVLWGFSQLVTYHRKERITTLLSQEMNLNQWVWKPSHLLPLFSKLTLVARVRNVTSNQIVEVLSSASWLVHTVDALVTRSCKT